MIKLTSIAKFGTAHYSWLYKKTYNDEIKSIKIKEALWIEADPQILKQYKPQGKPLKRRTKWTKQKTYHSKY